MTTSPGQPAPEPTWDAPALYEQREWLRVTLASIGDAVITTDTEGRVTFLNPTAEALSEWTREDAAGQPLEAFFAIVNEESRQTVENPVTRALREGLVVGLANHTLLIARDGAERPIDDSAAPIRNAQGQVAGCVLVFRDITERRRAERQIQHALAYAEDITFIAGAARG
jgi:PAS domain S-box-containing protein